MSYPHACAHNDGRRRRLKLWKSLCQTNIHIRGPCPCFPRHSRIIVLVLRRSRICIHIRRHSRIARLCSKTFSKHKDGETAYGLDITDLCVLLNPEWWPHSSAAVMKESQVEKGGFQSMGLELRRAVQEHWHSQHTQLLQIILSCILSSMKVPPNSHYVGHYNWY